MNDQAGATMWRRIKGARARQLQGLGAATLVVSICAMPFLASAAVPASGCPAGTFESYTESFATPVASVQVANYPITYVWVDTAAGRFLFGSGTELTNSVIDVAGQIGEPATQAGFCKTLAATTTTTTLPTTTTTTTVPETTTTTTTAVPETTTTSTTVPDTTSTTSTSTTSTTSTSTTTTTSPASTTTDPATTTTTDAQSLPPTIPESTTTTTTPLFAVLPPSQAAPTTVPPSAGAPGPTPLATTLPETGSSSLNSLLLGTTVLGLGMLLIGLSRRSA